MDKHPEAVSYTHLADGLAEVFARQMTKPDGKYIVFCSGREHMDEMKAQAADWFSKVDKKPHIYTCLLYTSRCV